MDPSPRYYALDNLRGIMMWLGIVLHVAVNHLASPSQLPWKDSQTSPVADLILMLIHAFRMPVFFILAGFFAARMIEQRGAAGMLRNRLRRIGLPLLIFWPILALLTGWLALMYVHLMQRGVVGIDVSLMPQRSADHPLITRLHLWFLVDLLWLYGVSALLLRFRQFLPVSGVLLRLMCSWWGVLFLTLPLALIGTLYPHGILSPALSFAPNLPELAHHGLFYAAGWTMYVHRDAMLQRLRKTCGRHGLAGFVAFATSLAMLRVAGTSGYGMVYADFATAFFFNCAAWCWSFALVGAFSKYTTQQSAWMRYLSDSSYWVYLVHMLGTIGFGILLYDAPLNFAAKMALNIVATTAACLLTYELLVRHTPIGMLLTGRRSPAQRDLAVRVAA